MAEPEARYPFARDVVQCPFQHLRRVREQEPVYQVEGLPFFLITRHEDLVEAARSPERYSSRRDLDAYEAIDFFSADEDVKAVYASAGPTVLSLAYTDPPVHSRHRRLVSRWFSPKAIKERWQPVVERHVDQLVSGFERDGNVEFMHRFAIPFPIRVIAEILGVTTDRVLDFKRWSDADMKAPAGATTHEQWMERAEAHVEMSAFLNAEIDERLAHPRDDLMGELVQATQEQPGGPDDDLPLTREEVQSMVQQMLVAGNETTTQLLGETMHLLLTHPAVLEQVTADPTLVPNLVEEGLRHASPVIGNFRSTTADTEINGTLIPRGSVVGLLWGAANHDPEVFEDPEEFRLDRPNPEQHVALGHGVHYCLGATLARTEARTAFGELLRRLPGLRLPPGFVPDYGYNLMVRGLSFLPVEFDAA